MRRFEDIKHNIAALASEMYDISYFYFEAMEGQGDPEFSIIDKLNNETSEAVRILSQAITKLNDCQYLHKQLSECGATNQPLKP